MFSKSNIGKHIFICYLKALKIPPLYVSIYMFTNGKGSFLLIYIYNLQQLENKRNGKL